MSGLCSGDLDSYTTFLLKICKTHALHCIGVCETAGVLVLSNRGLVAPWKIPHITVRQ